MTTTIYQKFISRYATIFTLVEMTEGCYFNEVEIVPAAKVAKMDEEEFCELLEELRSDENEKASWCDVEEPFDEEDARAGYHQHWQEINSDLDNRGL